VLVPERAQVLVLVPERAQVPVLVPERAQVPVLVPERAQVPVPAGDPSPGLERGIVRSERDQTVAMNRFCYPKSHSPPADRALSDKEIDWTSRVPPLF